MEVEAFGSNPSFPPSSSPLTAMVPDLSPASSMGHSDHLHSPDSAVAPPPIPGVDFAAGAATQMAVIKVQKVYRGYRTRRRLADTAVVAEELWWQAINFARLNYSTISFFNFSTPETASSRWSRVSLNASKVGKGFGQDSKAQTLAFQHWIEAIDPRHRYGHNLHKYYEVWCNTNSGQPFFYWLDVGDGKDLDLKEKGCSRSELKDHCVKYLGPQEREHYEYVVVDGKIIHKQSEDLLDTKEGSKWIFVMSTSERLYVGQKKKGKFHHSSFLAGGTTIAAGRLVADCGDLKSISAYSGHYRPSDDKLDAFMEFLKRNGVNLDQVQIDKASDDSSYSFDHNDQATEPSKPSAGSMQVDSNHNDRALEPPRASQNTYRRTLSGGLQSPRAELPKAAVLRRINSKKEVKSYQLGRQVQSKWSTGMGPRIGCIADYPLELQIQALEFTDLSPRQPPTPSPFQRPGGSAASPCGSPQARTDARSDL